MNLATDLFDGQRVSLSNFLNPGPIEGVIALRSEDGSDITVQFDKPVHISTMETGKSVFPLSKLHLLIGPTNIAHAPAGEDWIIEPITREGPSARK